MPSLEAHSAAPPADPFSTGLRIVKFSRSLRRYEIAVMEKACPGSEGKWDESIESLPLDHLPPGLSAEQVSWVLERRLRIDRERKLMLPKWEKIRPVLLAAAEALVEETWCDQDFSDDDLCHLRNFPAFGDDVEALAVCVILAELAVRAKVIDTGSRPAARNTHPLDDTHLHILKFLFNSTTPKQHKEIMDKVEISRGTLSKRLKDLRHRGLTQRSEGKRLGESITDAGRTECLRHTTHVAH
jgi:CRP-like cAMP-binding protein